MKKRLRKKLRLGEWQQFGFQVTFTGKSPSETIRHPDFARLERFNQAMDALHLDGWGSGTAWVAGKLWEWKADLFVPTPYGSATERHRAEMAAWLAAEPDIVVYQVGPLIDRNHSPEWMDSSVGSRYWKSLAP